MNYKIKYPSKISWRVDIAEYENPYEIFGPKLRKKLKSSIHKLEANQDINYIVEKVDLSYIDKFYLKYKNNIIGKQGVIHDVHDKIIHNPPHKFTYNALSLYKGNEYLGGLIFSDRKDHFVGAYKVFPEKFDFTSKVSPTLIAEYKLYEYAMNRKISYIRRGKDRNLYGLNANIGLVAFKIKSGTYPCMVSENDQVEEFDEFNWDGKKDILIFHSAEKGKKIEKASFFIANKSPDEYDEKYKIILNQSKFSVEIIN